MTDSFATYTELQAALSAAYAAPAEDAADRLILSASELIDYECLGRAQAAFDGTDDGLKASLSRATCAQVEYWLEVGEEHDVVGLPAGSALIAGRVQIQKLPGQLGQRARRILSAAGLYYAGVNAR